MSNRSRAPHTRLALALRTSVPSLRSASIMGARARFAPMSATLGVGTKTSSWSSTARDRRAGARFYS